MTPDARRRKNERRRACYAQHKANNSPVYVNSICKTRIRTRQHKKDLRRWYSDLKWSTGCFFCDEYLPCVLDYHHIDRSTKADDVSKLVTDNRSRERILSEIKKCVLLCSNCHRKVENGFLLLGSSLGRALG